MNTLNQQPLISIILVTYKEEKELMKCLVSLQKEDQAASATKHPFEIIIIDNNAKGRLKSVINKKFPGVKYINSGADIGYGAGNNLGAKYAHGKYLFFINPDTEIEKDAINNLAEFLNTHPKAAIVAPTFFDMQGIRFADQGSAELTPLTAIFSHSIIHKAWPANPIAQNYWMRGQDFTKPQQLPVIPGTAFMVRKAVFEEIGGFDERFFLYFEESDLCRRVRLAGWQVWRIPGSKIRHIWHAATQGAVYNIYFRQSRYKYFNKWYGSGVATLVELLLNIGKRQLIVLLLFLIGLLLLVTTL